jgi:hypothetical protein
VAGGDYGSCPPPIFLQWRPIASIFQRFDICLRLL